MMWVLWCVVWSLVSYTIILGTVPIACEILGARARQRRLRMRPLVAAADWFTPFGDRVSAYRDKLTDFLVMLADRLGVNWTQLRPDDTLFGSLNYDQPYRRFAVDDYEDIMYIVEDWAQKHNVELVGVKARDDSLGEYVAALLSVLESQAE